MVLDRITTRVWIGVNQADVVEDTRLSVVRIPPLPQLFLSLLFITIEQTSDV